MSNRDAVTVFTVTGDSDGASNGIINATTNRTGVLIHKVILGVTSNLASNALSVAINDHANIGSSAVRIFLSTSSSSAFAEDEYERYISETYDPPVLFTQGVSLDFSGLAAGWRAFVHYTRQ